MLRRRRSGERGAVAVEFALVMLPMSFLIFGLLEYGWYFFVAQDTSGAATTVARRLEVGDCWGSGQALTLAKSQSPKVTAATPSPSVTTPPAVGTTFTLTLTANANLLHILPLPNSGTVTRTVTSQVEDTTGSC